MIFKRRNIMPQSSRGAGGMQNPKESPGGWSDYLKSRPTGGGGSCVCSDGRSGVMNSTGGCVCGGEGSGRGNYAKGGKLDQSPFYRDGGKNPELRLAPEGSFTSFPKEGGSDVQKLLEMLSNYDQNAPIGEFLNVLMEMGGQGGEGAGQLRVAPEGSFTSFPKEAGSAMRNLPPQDVESLLMQLQQQGR